MTNSEDIINILVPLRDAISSKATYSWTQLRHDILAQQYQKARETTYQLNQFSQIHISICEEIKALIAQPFNIPIVGECLYYDYAKEKYLVVVTQIKPPSVITDSRYNRFDNGEIRIEAISATGVPKVSGPVHTLGFASYARKVEAKEILSPAYILRKDKYTDEQIQQIIPLIPFLPIPKGKYLNRYILRKLAKQVAKTTRAGTKVDTA